MNQKTQTDHNNFGHILTIKEVQVYQCRIYSSSNIPRLRYCNKVLDEITRKKCSTKKYCNRHHLKSVHTSKGKNNHLQIQSITYKTQRVATDSGSEHLVDPQHKLRQTKDFGLYILTKKVVKSAKLPLVSTHLAPADVVDSYLIWNRSRLAGKLLCYFNVAKLEELFFDGQFAGR